MELVMAVRHPVKMLPQEIMERALAALATGPKTSQQIAEGMGLHAWEIQTAMQRLRKGGKIEVSGREWVRSGIRSYWANVWRLDLDICRTCLRDITEHEDPDNTGFAFCRESGCAEFKGGHG